MRAFVVFFIVVFLAGCTQSFELQLAPEVKAYVEKSHEQPTVLTAEDEMYQDLNTWLTEHKSNWLTTSGRYPGGVYIKSGDHGIQVTGMSIVIYSTAGDKPQAMYVQNIPLGDLKGIRHLEKIEH